MPDVAQMLASRIREVPDFPQPGVNFLDITPLLDDSVAFGQAVEAIAAVGRGPDGEVAVDKVVAMEARGFLLGAPVALDLGVGVVPVRKPGKLPWKTRSVDYDLEYGSATLQMHDDALAAGERVLLVDDVLATGGTAAAAAELVRTSGAIVTGLAVLLEITALGGRAALPDVPVTALRSID